MILKYDEGDKAITINSLKMIPPGEVWQVYEHEGRAIIVLHPDSSLRNVLCYDENAQLLWTIEEANCFTLREGPGFAIVARDGVNEDGQLLPFSRGRPFGLDIDTGKVAFIPGNFQH